MNIFFDNCTSPTMASTLNGFVEHLGHHAVHIKDLSCGRNAADIEWITLLARDDSDWLVVTGDLRIQRNRAERHAFRQAGLKGVVLAPAYQSFPLNQATAFLLWRWPDVETLVRLTAPPFLFELPAKRGSRMRLLPF